ncbi:hypothetical protein FHW89_003424 [Mucilaginibacter sp. SG564]|nr:hypothetical protein [Mucilaginibacter sp. SG564]
MPAKKILCELKLKIPFEYVNATISTNKKRYDINMSNQTVVQLFKKYNYSKKLHNTRISAAFTQQKIKTGHLTEGHVYKLSILQYYIERKGLMQ